MAAEFIAWCLRGEGVRGHGRGVVTHLWTLNIPIIASRMMNTERAKN